MIVDRFGFGELKFSRYFRNNSLTYRYHLSWLNVWT